MTPRALLLLCLIAGAGCLGAAPTDEIAADPLAQPPQWQIGQWWDIELHHARTGNDLELRQVVAGHEGERWFVGMPHDQFVDYALIMHFPALGDLWGPGLGFDAHDRPIEWLRFPLHNETTWTTSFYWNPSEEVTATVLQTGPNTATISMNGTRPITIDYDARVGAPVHVRIDNYVEWWVKDYGINHAGTVLVPVEQDLVFYHGRTALTPVDTTLQRPESQSILLGDYDRASFAVLMYDAFADQNLVGHADIRGVVTAPDGNRFTANKDLRDTGDVLIPFGHGPVEGTWEFQAAVFGAGSVLLEGIAYDVMETQLGSQR